MTPSTAKLLRAAVQVEIDLGVPFAKDWSDAPIQEEIAHYVRIVRQLVQAPQGLGKKGLEPTDLEIEQEVKAQLAERAARAFEVS